MVASEARFLQQLSRNTRRRKHLAHLLALVCHQHAAREPPQRRANADRPRAAVGLAQSHEQRLAQHLRDGRVQLAGVDEAH